MSNGDCINDSLEIPSEELVDLGAASERTLGSYTGLLWEAGQLPFRIW